MTSNKKFGFQELPTTVNVLLLNVMNKSFYKNLILLFNILINMCKHFFLKINIYLFILDTQFF